MSISDLERALADLPEDVTPERATVPVLISPRLLRELAYREQCIKLIGLYGPDEAGYYTPTLVEVRSAGRD